MACECWLSLKCPVLPFLRSGLMFGGLENYTLGIAIFLILSRVYSLALVRAFLVPVSLSGLRRGTAKTQTKLRRFLGSVVVLVSSAVLKVLGKH